MARIPDHLEIERRFLVDAREEKPWREAEVHHAIEQHYGVGNHLHLEQDVLFCGEVSVVTLSEEQVSMFTQSDDWVSRLRQRGDDWFLTYKSRRSKDTAFELEWVVRHAAARAIMACGPFPSIQKTRYVWTSATGDCWEIDEFEKGLAGLVLAEIELEHGDQEVTIPAWVGQEITGLSSWSNRALAETLASRTD